MMLYQHLVFLCIAMDPIHQGGRTLTSARVTSTATAAGSDAQGPSFPQPVSQLTLCLGFHLPLSSTALLILLPLQHITSCLSNCSYYCIASSSTSALLHCLQPVSHYHQLPNYHYFIASKSSHTPLYIQGQLIDSIRYVYPPSSTSPVILLLSTFPAIRLLSASLVIMPHQPPSTKVPLPLPDAF
jgi:hypothetical protein